MEGWQHLLGLDAHSLAANPQFMSVGSPIPTNSALAGAGTSIAEVQEDFFGNMRADPPTVGAVELEGANQPPVVSAGADKSVTLPVESVILRGTGYDPDGSFRKFRWEKVSGPEVTLERQNTANVIVKDLVAGEYVFRFSATDNDGAIASDEMTLTVVGDVNEIPIVSAGSDKTVYLPEERVVLSGTGYDPDGVFRSFLWEKVSGPSVTMSQQRTANLVLTDLQEGPYVFRFSATDNGGATGSDEVTLTVKRINMPPVVSAGPDKTISEEEMRYVISGTGFDPDGRFRAFIWEKVSGPAVTLQQQNTANLVVTDFVVGQYVFRFSATDNDGATSSDEMSLTVKAAPAALATGPGVSAYPNEFQTEVNVVISAEATDEYLVEVYDMSGMVFFSQTFIADPATNAEHLLDFSRKNMREGVYFLRVDGKNSGLHEVVKLIKR